ncbi:MAG: hypothetical protein WBD58_00150 [Geitlerinemataceae cyanobacterium]
MPVSSNGYFQFYKNDRLLEADGCSAIWVDGNPTIDPISSEC